MVFKHKNKDKEMSFHDYIRQELNSEMLPLSMNVDYDTMANKDNKLTEQTEHFLGIEEIEVKNRLIDYGSGHTEIREYGSPYKKRVNLLRHKQEFEESERDIFEENRASGAEGFEVLLPDRELTKEQLDFFKDESRRPLEFPSEPPKEKDGDSDGKVIRHKDLSPEEKKKRNDRRSLNRSKDKIRELTLANDFKYFVTLTIDPEKVNDRYDDDEIIKKFRNWMKNLRKRKYRFSYLAIPERHKDGAIHFHMLMSGDYEYYNPVRKGWFPDDSSHPLMFTWSGKSTKDGRFIFHFDDWRFGFSTVIELDGQRERVANYVVKYIAKQFNDDNAISPRYIPSRDLKEAKMKHNVDASGYIPVFTKVDNETGEVLYRVLRKPEDVPHLFDDDGNILPQKVKKFKKYTTFSYI